MARVPRAQILFDVLRALRAESVADVALVGSSLAAAAASVVFAGFMLIQGDHPPNVNGLEYLAIFARPHSAAKPSEDAAPGPAATTSFDMTPVGAIGGTTTSARDFALVAARSDIAWVRDGGKIFAVRPGEEAPRMGRVAAILERDGQWILVGEGDATLLSGPAAAVAKGPPNAPFARRMIFGSEK